MERIAKYFIGRPLLFWSVVAALVVAGVLSFVQMPKLEDPAIVGKQAVVVVMYPGASAHDVELRVARVLEDELRALPGVKRVDAECQAGTAMMTVEFLMTVQAKDLEQHFDLLRRKVAAAQMKLPQECYAPVVVDDMTDTYGLFYALTADGYTYPEMDRYAKLIKNQLITCKGVKRCNVVGGRDEVINIELSKEQLLRNGMIGTQIMMALQNSGKVVDAGQSVQGPERLSVFVDSDIRGEDDIRDLRVSMTDGKVVRLGDIATVTRQYGEPQRNGFFIGRKPAIAICIALEASAIVPDVGKLTDAKLAEVMGDVPAGIEVSKIFFQPDKVDEAIASFLLNLVESVLIVIIVLIFTMGFRSGVIIGVGLVLTVCASFPILLAMGTTLQRISLGAFIVAMGMLVDNSVVIMDGILIDKARGLGPKTYLFRIGRNTAIPLLGATAIAASTFLCVFLSPDTAGEYASDLFRVLCVSLLLSWVFALIQVPMCAKQWLPARPKDDGKPKGQMNSPVHRVVRRVIQAFIGHKAVTISVAVALCALCGYGLTVVKNVFFPDFSYEQIVVECFFDGETDANHVRDRMLQMSDALSADSAVQKVCMSQGTAPAHYTLTRPATNGGDCYGELIVDFRDYDALCQALPRLRRTTREQFPDAYIRFRKYNFSVNTTHTIEVEFSGPDPAVLRDLSARAEDIMRGCKYIDEYSVQNNWKPRGKNVTAHFLEQEGLRTGKTRGDVANALQAAGEGMPIGVINDQDRMVQIKLQVRNADHSRVGDLTQLPVWSMLNINLNQDAIEGALAGGKGMQTLQDNMFRSVPLGSVCSSVELASNEDVVRRHNGRRAIEAECDPNAELDEATSAKAIATIKPLIEAIPLPPGYETRWVGDDEITNEAIGNIMKYVPITAFAIIIVLLFLFESWKKVGLILMVLPFVLCGITPTLLLFNSPFTFMAIIGMIGLMGMMIKNAIVLVDEIGRLQTEEHEEPFRAVIEATVSRVRPVMMASLTTIVGMVPLLPDPMYGSMAMVIMGGLLIGTMVTLMLLPLFYTALFGVKRPDNYKEIR